MFKVHIYQAKLKNYLLEILDIHILLSSHPILHDSFVLGILNTFLNTKCNDGFNISSSALHFVLVKPRVIGGLIHQNR